MSDVNENLTKVEVAKRYRVKTRTIELWVAEGKFPKPLKPGYKTALWPQAELDKHDDRIRKGEKPRYE